MGSLMFNSSPVFLQTLTGGLVILYFFCSEDECSMYHTQAASASHWTVLEPSPHDIWVLSSFIWTYIFMIYIRLGLEYKSREDLEAFRKIKKYIHQENICLSVFDRFGNALMIRNAFHSRSMGSKSYCVWFFCGRVRFYIKFKGVYKTSANSAFSCRACSTSSLFNSFLSASIILYLPPAIFHSPWYLMGMNYSSVSYSDKSMHNFFFTITWA